VWTGSINRRPPRLSTKCLSGWAPVSAENFTCGGGAKYGNYSEESDMQHKAYILSTP
jgi:hypothetical protein